MSSIPAAKEKSSARAVLEAWDRRVTELLAANNSYLERARRAEEENAKLRAERDEVLTALKIAEAYAHHAIDHAIHHAPRERADLAKADQALIAVLVGFALVEAIVIGLQGQGLKKAHDRLREYADTIRALKEKLEQPRAPKGWTHG